jgi:hypothetical protein
MSASPTSDILRGAVPRRTAQPHAMNDTSAHGTMRGAPTDPGRARA